MNITPNIFLKKNCYKSNIILCLNQFLNLKIKFVYFETISKEDQEKIISKSPTGNIPLLQKGDYYLSGTKAILKFLLSQTDNSSLLDFLHPSNIFESSHIEMWIDYAVNNIWVLLENLLIIDDKGLAITRDEELKEVALKELHNVLSKINETLKFQTFLVSTNFTLADLIFASSLKPIYENIIDGEIALKYNNVIRWLKLASSLKEFKAIHGETKFNL